MEIKLTGGPSGLGRHASISDAEPPDRVVIRYLNGYEHFEISEYDGEVPTYRWIYSTKIAE
ncbi:DUF5988 family protein [Streptomyces bacillaris]|uniref:DUF5988 family protein n=1 Tax=Streptomyces bacillaris TaxID=68179 RepID=UPI00345F7064